MRIDQTEKTKGGLKLNNLKHAQWKVWAHVGRI